MRVAGGPFYRRHRIVDGGWKFMLGRKAIIYEKDEATRFQTEPSANMIVGIKIAEASAAAVKIDKNRQQALPGVFRAIKARAESDPTRFNLTGFRGCRGRRIACDSADAIEILASRLPGRQRIGFRRAGAFCFFENSCELGRERLIGTIGHILRTL